MKTLVFFDTHLLHRTYQKVIDKVQHDSVVLTGDIFDSRGEPGAENANTISNNLSAAKWLCDFLKAPNHTALWGNHDTQYRWPDNPFVRCNPNCYGLKKEDINKVLPDEVWDKTCFYHVEQGFLLSHAGLTLPLYAELLDTALEDSSFSLDAVTEFLRGWTPPLLECLNNNEYHPLIGVGRDRGGWDANGGLTWGGWHRFQAIPNVKQAFGHTSHLKPQFKTVGTFDESFDAVPSDFIERTDGGWCGDCRGSYFATIEDGKLEFHLTVDHL